MRWTMELASFRPAPNLDPTSPCLPLPLSEQRRFARAQNSPILPAPVFFLHYFLHSPSSRPVFSLSSHPLIPLPLTLSATII